MLVRKGVFSPRDSPGERFGVFSLPGEGEGKTDYVLGSLQGQGPGGFWAKLSVEHPSGGRSSLTLLNAETFRGRMRGFFKKLLGTCLKDFLEKSGGREELEIVFKDVVNPMIKEYYDGLFGELVECEEQSSSDPDRKDYFLRIGREKLEGVVKSLLAADVLSAREQRRRAIGTINRVLGDCDDETRSELADLISFVRDRELLREDLGPLAHSSFADLLDKTKARKFVDAFHALLDHSSGWTVVGLGGEGVPQVQEA